MSQMIYSLTKMKKKKNTINATKNENCAIIWQKIIECQNKQECYPWIDQFKHDCLLKNIIL